VKPAEIDELITMVEAGQDVRIQYPTGLTVQLTEHHLDDLHLAKAASVFFAEMSKVLATHEPDWLRP
jgi:hypothetical protein